MAEYRLTLSEQEKEYLERILKVALGETRVEARHTHYSPEFRQQVLGEEELVRQLLAKVQKPASI
jgi:hypothetical protein